MSTAPAEKQPESTQTSPPLTGDEHVDPEHNALTSDNEGSTSRVSLDDPVADDLPEADHPTVALLIPFPPTLRQPSKKDDKVPPFMIYAPMAAPLPPLKEGEKDSLTNKAIRKWQKEEKEAREKGTGFKHVDDTQLISKGMSATKNSRIEFLVRTPNKKKLKELRFVYPRSWPAEHVREDFTQLVKSAKKGAIMNGIIATSMAPFALAFDTLTFIPGVRSLSLARVTSLTSLQPFEITAVWSASSWTGAARATGIANRVTSSSLPIAFIPDPALDMLRFRVHELCYRYVRPGTLGPPQWNGAEGGPVKRGPDLAGLVLEALRAHGEDMDDLETDRRIVAEDMERCLKKAAKEWVKTWIGCAPSSKLVVAPAVTWRAHDVYQVHGDELGRTGIQGPLSLVPLVACTACPYVTSKTFTAFQRDQTVAPNGWW
ncbi:hypothetical protein POSPLADRAFT_1034491 [Postia placenta MAD-698-R-SB12]|uniref:Uncharacterized protein n=1 Tax=Postia placenta MAD-698-R-SB12 TaxID=670580 RepID=A0A1X6MX40_9APHY|nr:hypothetical protein POSPLADRAFT_1034491 [Postia placenta MAD-698-R-SB12]OSX60921.1 hypothetical protein POSPLADRAFT_1034491 [Postia placenta MAD-698-R-SB12]